MNCNCCGSTIGHEDVLVCPNCKTATFVYDLISLSDIDNHKQAVYEWQSFQDSAFVIENNVLLEYKGNKKDVVIPMGVEVISDHCFTRTDARIESVVIPRTVKYINSNSRNNQEDVANNGAFEFCESLRKVVFADNSELKVIGRNAFYKCKNFRTIEGLEHLNNVCIEQYSFGGCPDDVINAIRSNKNLECDERWSSVT